MGGAAWQREEQPDNGRSSHDNGRSSSTTWGAASHKFWRRSHMIVILQVGPVESSYLIFNILFKSVFSCVVYCVSSYLLCQSKSVSRVRLLGKKLFGSFWNRNWNDLSPLIGPVVSKLYIGVTFRVSELNKSRGLWDALGGGGVMSGKGTKILRVSFESMCIISPIFFSLVLYR